MDFAFLAVAFNIKKLCSKIAKQTNNGDNTPHFCLFLLILRILTLKKRIFLEITEIVRLKNIQKYPKISKPQ